MKRNTKERIRKSRLWNKQFKRKNELNLFLTNFIDTKGVIREMPIKFDDIKGYSEEDFKLPRLQKEFLDKKIQIESIRFGESQFGTYAVATIKLKEYFTSATILVTTLQRIAEMILEYDDTVEVTIKKVKNYYMFV